MIRAFSIFWAIAAAISASQASAETQRLSATVEVERLDEGVWLLRTTCATEKWGVVGANGLAVVSGKQALFIDPGWDDTQATTLLNWARETLHVEIGQAVVTHAHDDRIGGIRALLSHDVAVVESARTAKLAAAQGYPAPTRTFENEARLEVGALTVQVVFPGAGHSRDNVVAYIPARHLLFGGCFVKEEAAKDLGNLADADVRAWAGSLASVKTRFADATIVVPGHGVVGGMALIDHSIALATATAQRLE